MIRIADLVLSLILLMVAIPLLAVATFLISVESRGWPVFSQVRIGKYGKEFIIYKLRTMYVNASKDGNFATKKGDKRITRVGGFLRATSIDELPQLINVIRGDMSFVGPRPDVPTQKEMYTEREFIFRHSVQPGITGLAQIRGRSGATHEIRLKNDCEWVEKRSFTLYLKILMITVYSVLTKLAH
ncbi:sugar transferase [Synechococcus sp. CC9311]|uniref:sugar transferase n=1 Tax=Synechococcus sp. (strain CC9311) TaxID=64471 RepID=UPI0000DDA9C9|nr:sugar transferase [Synechococcus sp. CC9311]ABI47167.1 undecaprenyl-phosphate glucosephosphotransferase [Synechococcus sp. CC9311]